MTQLQQVEDKLQHYRRIKYLLSKPEFQGITVPEGLIGHGDSNRIYEYLKTTLGLEELTVANLREKAAILRVMPIFGLTKSQLISKIREKQDELAKSQKQSC